MATRRSRATPQIATTSDAVISTIMTQPGTSPRSSSCAAPNSDNNSPPNVSSSAQGTSRSSDTNPGYNAHRDVIGANPDLLRPGQVLELPPEHA